MLSASNNTTMKFSFIQPAHIHEQGTRSNQEDSIFPQAGTASSEDRLYIVCDGMGGHEHGEVASSTVCEALSDYLFQNTTSDEPLTDELLTGALTYAYERLTEALGDKSSASPGTTLAMLYFHRGGCAAVHIGDSRIYHIRPSERRIMYKSRDHSLVYDLYLSGNLEYAAMKQHPRKNVITRVMMPAPNQRCRADVAHITDVAMGDVFMLCSDGLLENIDDAEIVDVLSSGQTAATMAESLKAMTSENKDNRSAYLIQVEGVMREMRDQNLRDTEAEMLQRSICRIESGTTVVLTDESVQETVQQPAQPQYQQPAQPQYQQPAQPQYQQPAQPQYQQPVEEERPRRKGLLVPMLTTIVLAGILLAVFFTCRGNSSTRTEEPEAVSADTAKKEKKVERDTFNIMSDSKPTIDSEKPQPSGPAEEKKAEEKKDEKKAEEKKAEEKESTQPATTESAAPSKEEPVIETVVKPSEVGTATPPAPVNEGPKPVVPDGE